MDVSISQVLKGSYCIETRINIGTQQSYYIYLCGNDSNDKLNVEVDAIQGSMDK